MADPIDLGGLTATEVSDRQADGRANEVDDRSSRSLRDIVRSNVLTRFNAIVAGLALVILVVGDVRDALFAGVMISNAVIGIAQELRSKATLDRLSLVAAPRLVVIRDGEETTVESSQIVLDDLVIVTPGDQIVVDGTIVDSDALSVDESLLTGEADAVEKPVDEQVLSGSFVAAGSGVMRATAVGDDSYAAGLAREARAFRSSQSELQRGIDAILRFVTWLIVPAGIGLFLAQRYGDGSSLDQSLVGTVAGLVALVPQGLVLLLSMAQAVAVIRLGRRQVLVQQLHAVEQLARVTLLATDKTGTLTTGAVAFDHVDLVGGQADGSVDEALAALAAADGRPDATMAAIAAAHAIDPGWRLVQRIPFASAYKYSAAAFEDQGAWYIGAPEVLLAPGAHLDRVAVLAEEGRRVLALGRAASLAATGEIPDDLVPVAIVVCGDEIRADAAETIAYFGNEGVTTKVISGDNPQTVAAIARQCGVPDAEHYVDARTLPTDEVPLAESLETVAVFGRVTPEVKRGLVHAAQSNGDVVAMTGDGVNDTLALKDADLGIAMGAGTSAAKSVAEIVLLDNRFATLPGVVAEGRRVIANIERVARLFVAKTAWAATFAVIIGLGGTAYPLLPRQLTIVDALTIGIPGFVLSFQPSHEPASAGFLGRVLRFSIPVGVLTGIAGMITFATTRSYLIGDQRPAAQSATALTITLVGLVALHELMRPLDKMRSALLVSLCLGLIGAYTLPPIRDFFLLELPDAITVVVAVVSAVAGSAGVVFIAREEMALERQVWQPLLRRIDRRHDARRGDHTG